MNLDKIKTSARKLISNDFLTTSLSITIIILLLLILFIPGLSSRTQASGSLADVSKSLFNYPGSNYHADVSKVYNLQDNKIANSPQDSSPLNTSTKSSSTSTDSSNSSAKKPRSTPRLTSTPKPTSTPRPTATPKLTAIPKPTVFPTGSGVGEPYFEEYISSLETRDAERRLFAQELANQIGEYKVKYSQSPNLYIDKSKTELGSLPSSIVYLYNSDQNRTNAIAIATGFDNDDYKFKRVSSCSLESSKNDLIVFELNEEFILLCEEGGSITEYWVFED